MPLSRPCLISLAAARSPSAICNRRVQVRVFARNRAAPGRKVIGSAPVRGLRIGEVGKVSPIYSALQLISWFCLAVKSSLSSKPSYSWVTDRGFGWEPLMRARASPEH